MGGSTSIPMLAAVPAMILIADSMVVQFKSLSIEKERERRTAIPTHIASSLSFHPFGYHKLTEVGGEIFSFGSDIAGSPDNYVCRQRYLRSYVFTREEESNKSFVQKVKRLFKGKKKGREKQKKASQGNTNSCSFYDTAMQHRQSRCSYLSI
ncbi:hypothetical protein D5086_014470 [Populus alba]|uniref:Uncharacterized protein n=1 Tax=Populus alba TaxID=43335 RepID=A0ACC4BXL1_POPAL